MYKNLQKNDRKYADLTCILLIKLYVLVAKYKKSHNKTLSYTNRTSIVYNSDNKML